MSYRRKLKHYIDCKTNKLLGQFYSKEEARAKHGYTKHYAKCWITRVYNAEKYMKRPL